MPEPAQLIAEIIHLDDWIDGQQKRFDEHLKPHREKIETLKVQLQEFLLANAKTEGGHPHASFSCDSGTAYLSTVTTPSIEGDKTGFLDWCLDSWDERGDMLMIGKPQKNALDRYMDSHNGQLPPFVKISSLTRVNVRRS